MEEIISLQNKVLDLKKNNFESLALEVFQFQAFNNPIYREWIGHLKIDIGEINQIQQIPFLPIAFFKNYKIQSGSWEAETIFKSSGTTSDDRSQHYIFQTRWYDQISSKIFNQFYGDFKDYIIIGLLPNYLEKGDSSLVKMVDTFIKKTQHPASGFFLDQITNLPEHLLKTHESNKGENSVHRKRKIILWGVSYAMIDLAELMSSLEGVNERWTSDLIVLETGGMKGRRAEWIKPALHQFLAQHFNVSSIHSEYGMTELLSQAYSKSEGLFEVPHSMRVLLRDISDPFDLNPTRRQGAINIIDLANIHSCSFIATDDLGRFGPTPNSFEVLGRLDAAQIRGCNLMVAN